MVKYKLSTVITATTNGTSISVLHQRNNFTLPSKIKRMMTVYIILKQKQDPKKIVVINQAKEQITYIDLTIRCMPL